MVQLGDVGKTQIIDMNYRHYTKISSENIKSTGIKRNQNFNVALFHIDQKQSNTQWL